MTILTTKQVAERLGITPRAVRALAERHDIGTKINDRMRVYSDEDVSRLRQRSGMVGRPLSLRAVST